MAWQLQLGFLCPEFLLPVWLYCHQREGQNMNSVAFVLDMQNPVLPSRNLDIALHQTIRTWPHLHVGEPKGCEKLQRHLIQLDEWVTQCQTKFSSAQTKCCTLKERKIGCARMAHKALNYMWGLGKGSWVSLWMAQWSFGCRAQL